MLSFHALQMVCHLWHGMSPRFRQETRNGIALFLQLWQVFMGEQVGGGGEAERVTSRRAG